MKVSIEGLSRAEVLAALYNNAKPLGLGQLHYHPKSMTVAEAQELINRTVQQAEVLGGVPSFYFDIYEGRALKVDLTNADEFDNFGFDRANGAGRAEEIVNDAKDLKERQSSGESVQTHDTLLPVEA